MNPEDLEILLQGGLDAAKAQAADPVRVEQAHAYWSGRAAEVAEGAGDARGAANARAHQTAARQRLAAARAEARREIAARARRVATIVVMSDSARRARPRARRDGATSKSSASSSGDDPPAGEPAALPVYPRRRTIRWSELVEPSTLRPPRQLNFDDEEACGRVVA